MNPELQRNIWLELSPLRLLLMPVALGLIFAAAMSVGGEARLEALGQTARSLHFLIVILWGTWLAARSVVSEVRERTWDGQRLSALGAYQLVWGKLFGATIYAWYGGAFILAALAFAELSTDGAGAAVTAVAYHLLIGVFAHAVAMLASLLAVRRRYAHRRIDVALFLIAGLIAASVGSSFWTAAEVAPAGATVSWFAFEPGMRAFFLGSLLIFVLWALIGCYRLMRTELQYRNSPVVFAGFLLYLMAYVAGLGASLELVEPLTRAGWAEMNTLYVSLAAAVAYGLLYAMAFLDPKDWVRYRWIGAALGRGAVLPALGALQGWMVAGLAFLACMGWLLLTAAPVRLAGEAVADPRLFILALVLFVLRDLALILFFNARADTRRGDLGALVCIALLYLVPVAMFGPWGAIGTLALFVPSPEAGSLTSVLSAGVQAALALALLLARLGAMGRGRVPA
ncbi:MAG: hypothetical protein HXY25_09120 [Alphaproteobacteria bacterium]|nr:hypothetical protein [Alphaproteobacteria bacterium]